jgi:hypothetical protein
MLASQPPTIAPLPAGARREAAGFLQLESQPGGDFPAMSQSHLIQPTSGSRRRWDVMLCSTIVAAGRDWGTSDGLVRYRHSQSYGFVLAGYTAALIDIPAAMGPNALFLAALTRASGAAVGIVCSSAVSALIMPQKSSLALQRALRNRYLDFTAFAVQVLCSKVERELFEGRFADLVGAAP